MSDKFNVCGLTLEQFNQLADRVENGNLSRIKIKAGSCELVIERESKSAAPAVQAVMPPVMNMVSQAASATLPEQNISENETNSEQANGNIVKSPIVGTYYSAPGPDKEPFVTVGKEVKKGDVIMIIESMKLMNEVQSEFDGIVKEILVENGNPVEFDQPIMIIE